MAASTHIPRPRRQAGFSLEPLEGRALLATLQNFDVPGTPFAYSSPEPPPVIPDGPTGNFLRLAAVDPISSSSISFERSDPGLYRQIVASFDFRITPQVRRADGLGFALLNTANYGSSGSVTAPFGLEELPNFEGSLGVGFDLFPLLGNEPTDNFLSLHFDAVKLASFPINRTLLDLADGQFITATILTNFATPTPTLSIALQPAGGSPLLIVDNYPVPDMAPYESRVHFGARGAGFGDFDLDNVNVDYQDRLLPGTFSVEPTQLAVPEEAGFATVRILRNGGDFGPASVQYTTIDNGATAGRDYTSISGTLRFNSGETVKELLIPIIDNNTVDRAGRDIRLIIVDPNVASNRFREASITILDNDTTTPPSVAPPTVSPRVQILRAGRRGSAQGFILSFSADLDPARAQDPSNYLVQSVQGRRRVRYRNIPIASATYDPTNRTVTLRSASGARITWPVLITVDGTSPKAITSASGVVLDGDRDGQPGGNALLTIHH